MSDLNWSNIGNGPTFQSLCSTIILHEDTEAQAYDRIGKDSGIDIKSGDGKIAYQTKYIGDQKFNIAIKESLNELKKIKEYKTPLHHNFEIWSTIKKWCLITNATLNPKDELKWNKKVVKQFKDEGFEDVILWHSEILKKKIIELPHVKQEYFDGENRVFISLSEKYEVLKKDEITLFAINSNFLGRENELEIVDKFLRNKDKLILPIHGSGGVGKTRFAFEVSLRAKDQDGWNVYWANIYTMSSSTKWFQNMNFSKKTLLVIDEPDDEKSIRILIEQITQSKMSNFKVLVITRSPKYPILQILKNPRLTVLGNELNLKPLSNTNIENYTKNLLLECKIVRNMNEFYKERLIKTIGEKSNGLPMWAKLAVLLINKEKSLNDLANDEYGLVECYIKEKEKYVTAELNCSRETFREILELLALFQPINIKDNKYLIDFIRNRTKLSKIEDLLEKLVSLNVCNKRGRYVELKPDIIRDYLIKNWLGKTHNAENLVREIWKPELFMEYKRVLQELSKLEFDFKLNQKNYSVLDAIVNDLKERAQKGTYEEKIQALEIASTLCFSRPIALVDISKILRTDIDANEDRKAQYTHISGLIYSTGLYSITDEERENVFYEILEFAKKEHNYLSNKNQKLNNNTHNALSFAKKLCIGGLDQFQTFEDIAENWIKKKLDKFLEIENAEMYIFEGLSDTLLSIEREDSYQHNMTFSFKRYLIFSESKANKIRIILRLKLWDIVRDINIDTTKRIVIWKLLKKSHIEAKKVINTISNQIKVSTNLIPSPYNGAYINNLENELIDNLIRIKEILQNINLSIEEISLLKEFWEWDLNFNKNINCMQFKLAIECEEIINRDEDVSSLNQLYKKYISLEKSVIPETIANKLNSKEKIFDFVSKAYNFSGENFRDGLFWVSNCLGKNFFTYSYISQYVIEVFESKNEHKANQYTASDIFYSALKQLKLIDQNKYFETFFTYYSLIKNQETQHIFLNYLLNSIYQVNVDTDLEILSRIIYENNFPIHSISILFNLLGYMVSIHFNIVKKNIESLWNRINIDETTNAYISIIEGVYHFTIYKDNIIFPKNFFSWLIGELNKIPNSINFNNTYFDHLLHIQRKSNETLDISWFYSFIKDRIDRIEKGILKNGSYTAFINQVSENFINKIDRTQEISKQTFIIFRKLLDYSNHNVDLQNSLPEILIQLDPFARILPELIIEKLRNLKFENAKENSITYLMRYIGYYSNNSEPWRKIVIEILKFYTDLNIEIDETLYSKFLSAKPFFSTLAIDKITPIFINDVNEAKKDLEDETEDVLKNFMRFKLKLAEQILENEKLRVEEGNIIWKI